MNEWAIMGYVTGSSLCFAIGGTGYKWVRRYVIPAITLVFLLTSGADPLMSALASLALLGALTLGYGEGRSYLERFLVGLAWVIPAWLISWTLWIVITPILWTGAFWLSNYQKTNKQFVWKLVELLAGFLIGCTYVGALGASLP